jgi:hypothetical protein
MKYKISIYSLALMGLFLILVCSCKKDDDSTYGNANIVTKKFTLNWTISAPNVICEIVDPDITQEVLDNGSVQVYIEYINGSDMWIQLPFTWPESSTNAAVFTPIIYLGGVMILLSNTDYSQVNIPVITMGKIVCISDKPL